MTFDPISARNFVNSIVNKYDRLHIPNSDPVPVKDIDIFDPNSSCEQTKSQQIFFEKFSLSKYFKGPVEKQDETYQKHIPNLSQLFIKTGVLEPSLESPPQRLADIEKKSDPTKKADEPVVGSGAPEKKDSELETQEGREEKKADDSAVDKSAAEKKGSEPEIEKKKKLKDGLFAQTSLELYQKEKENLTAELVQQEREKHKEYAINAIVQTFLRRENCELDPKDEVINRIIAKMTQIGQSIADRWPRYFRKPQFVKLYPDGKRLFFGHIFQEVYAKSDVEGKEKILALLKDYSTLLEKSEYVWERRLLSVEGKFSKLTTNPYFKIGASIAIGASLYLMIGYLIVPLAIQFFKSSVFVASSTFVLDMLPIVFVEGASQAVSGIIGVTSYVASTRLYWLIFDYNATIPVFLMNQFPRFAPFLGSILLARNPALIGVLIGGLLLGRSHGLDVRVQDSITKSLEKLKDREKAASLLEEGLKAYQVWMYLVQEGSTQNVFNLSQKFFRSSNGTKFLTSHSSRHMEFAYCY